MCSRLAATPVWFWGTSPVNPGAAEAFVGEIAEIIVYNAQLSETTQQSVNGYLTARYGF